MAQKSKTQRAKASAARQARKAAAEAEQLKIEEGQTSEDGVAVKKAETKPAPKAAEKKEPAKPKKKRFKFLREVKSEMKRVTWPTRNDVVRWSLVVVGALLFFGIYVAVLDNVIVTPLLTALSGLGA